MHSSVSARNRVGETHSDLIPSKTSANFGRCVYHSSLPQTASAGPYSRPPRRLRSSGQDPDHRRSRTLRRALLRNVVNCCQLLSTAGLVVSGFYRSPMGCRTGWGASMNRFFVTTKHLELLTLPRMTVSMKYGIILLNPGPIWLTSPSNLLHDVTLSPGWGKPKQPMRSRKHPLIWSRLSPTEKGERGALVKTFAMLHGRVALFLSNLREARSSCLTPGLRLCT